MVIFSIDCFYNQNLLTSFCNCHSGATDHNSELQYYCPYPYKNLVMFLSQAALSIFFEQYRNLLLGRLKRHHIYIGPDLPVR